MVSTVKLFSLLSQTLILFLLLISLFLPFVKTNSDYNTLVFKNCSSKTFTDSTDSHLQALSSLFQVVVPHSSQSKFFKGAAGDQDNNYNASVSGRFQCRGDLSNHDCFDCVNSLPELSNTLCNKALAGRIQLHGCYFHYESDEFSIDEPSSKHELLHKSCGEKGEDVGFEELRDEAFASMESGVIEGQGFYSGRYEYVHVMAQCDGDLVKVCDCGECVSEAVQIARQECGYSISGQVYLDRCFISYGYVPNEGSGNSYRGRGSGNNTGKSVAIILGGAAALGFGFIFLMFLKSYGKKDDIW